MSTYKDSGCLRMWFCRMFHRQHITEKEFRFGTLFICRKCNINRYEDNVWA